jgi:hypothetical protein
MALPQPPTGISTEAYSNRIKVIWRSSNSPNIIGYNIYNSQTSGGGISGYTRLNNELIQIYDSVSREVITTTETISEVGNVRTTTTTDNLETVYYYAYEHLSLSEEKEQFYVITAVNTNGEESLYSNEINDFPLIIDTNVVDLPRRRKGDVILQYLDDILRKDPLIDVKPGTVTRDIYIDPQGQEFEKAYILIDFLRVSSSFVSLLSFDDGNGDGISDLVSDSTKKIDLRSALDFLSDGSQDDLVQNIIDNQFDLLASRAYIVRKPPTKSAGEVTFYTNTPPNSDTIINIGTTVSTRSGQNTRAISFTTLSSATFIASQANTYYNTTNQRYELKVPIEAIETGTVGNVSANTIVNSAITGFSVANELSTFGGTDQESNKNLSDRAELAYRALDLGTLDGYRKTVIEIYNVEDLEIADAGHDLMMRDYDDLRKKHVFGKVDIYFQGQELEEFTETFGFLYTRINNEQVGILQVESGVNNLKVRVVNSNVTVNKPVFNLIYIRNVTQGLLYDLLGNITIY